MEDLDEYEALKIELQILRTLSNYKDEMIRRLYAEVILLRNGLEGSIVSAESSGNGRTCTDLARDALRLSQRSKKSPVALRQSVAQTTSADHVRFRIPSLPDSTGQPLAGGLQHRLGPSSSLSHQTKSICSGITPGMQSPHGPRDPAPDMAGRSPHALQQHARSLRIPCHAVPTAPPSMRALQFFPESTRTNAVLQNHRKHALVRQPLNVTHISTMRQEPWPHNSNTVSNAHSVDESSSSRGVPMMRDERLCTDRVSKCSFFIQGAKSLPQGHQSFKWILREEPTVKAGRGQGSTLSSLSTCSSVTPCRRRPWAP